MSIFLKDLRFIPNILKRQSCKIFTRLAPSSTSSRSSHRKYFLKKGVLKSFTGRHRCWSLSNEIAGLKAYNFIENSLQHSYFPVKFCKFLRTLNLKNICEWLFLPSWRHRFLYNNIIIVRSICLHYYLIKKLNIKTVFKHLNSK